MDIKSLRCFVEVAERLNFSRAAEALFLSQPTLSIRIAELERDLNTTLFIRDHQKVFLTSAGAILLPLIRKILTDIDTLPTAAQEAAQGIQQASSIIIGLDPTESRSDIRPVRSIMNNSRRMIPSTNVSIIPMDYSSYEESLLKGTVDLCFMVLQDSDQLHPDLLTVPLLRDATVLAAVGVGDMPLDEVLRTRDFLIYTNGSNEHWGKRYIDYIKHLHLETHIISVEDEAVLCMHLLYRNAAAFLPISYAMSLNDSNISIFPTDLEDTILTLVWNKHNLNPALQIFVNEARSETARIKR